MSYYPILSAPKCKGWTTVCNFPPNNWEYRDRNKKSLYLSWAEGGYWKSIKIDELAYGESKTVTHKQALEHMLSDSLPLLSLTDNSLPDESELLPVNKNPTVVPAWRASIGLETENYRTNYQGEIDPFPVPGSMLTFSPFIQSSNDIQNYILLMNIEKSAKKRKSNTEIYISSEPSKIISEIEVYNNEANLIPLDNAWFNENDLPVFINREMSSIPIYISIDKQGRLSLEHTHPPASYAIHGNRWATQKILKDRWFSILNK